MVDHLLAFIRRSITLHITCMNISEGAKVDAVEETKSMDNSSIKNSPSIVLNVEQFIRDVENRPAIWNRNYHCNKLFMEQTWDELSTIHKLPKQILKTKWKGLRDNFRVEYKRIPRNNNGEFLISPETHDSKWTHYQALLFLIEHMRHRHPKSDYFFSNQSGEAFEQTLVEPDLTNGLIQLPDDEDHDEIGKPSCRIESLQHLPECSSNDSAIFSNSTIRTTSSRNVGNGFVPAITIKRKKSEDNEDTKPHMEQIIDPDDDYHYLLSLHPYMKQLHPSQKLRLRTKIQKLIFKELYKEDLEDIK